jgi:phosphatidylethanolamine/phosphatidyl-N-methylethanolamine N-methyltransferase
MAEAYGAALGGPKAPMDADAVRAAYARWADNYDSWFGLVSRNARNRAVAAVNAAEGAQVLEVGVGTGLALPLYNASKRVTGIDLSGDMLDKARERVAELGLRNVEALLEMDAQATGFADGQFDLAVAMFVASVVPDPRALVKELRRVVRPGGTILFVNHFAQERGVVWWVERAMAPASARLGWHPDFRLAHMFSPIDLAGAKITPMKPMKLFRLVELKN